MPGDRFTQTELTSMSREDFERAAANGFQRLTSAEFSTGAFPVPADADRASSTPTQINLGSSVPRPEAPAPDANAWSTAKASRSKDFTCPSGQTCRLKRLEPESLLQAGILDKITRLEGLADTLVQTAEGAPPAPAKMPSREDFAMLLGTIDALVVLAVEQPLLLPVPEEGEARVVNAIYVDDVDLDDRMAIMEEALKGLKALDRFRNAG